MSLCRGKIYYDSGSEPRSPDEANVSFQFSSGDDSMMTSPVCKFDLGEIATPNSKFWDSGMGTPTPDDRSRASLRLSSRTMSPIKLNLDDSDDDGAASSDSPVKSSLCGTPPHKKFRKLRLYDTPHTPKTLLQKAQRRVTRANRQKLSVIRGSAEKAILPAANINPFSAGTWDGSPKPILGSGGVKRTRQYDERYCF